MTETGRVLLVEDHQRKLKAWGLGGSQPDANCG
jgi:hypothetical protein